MVKVISYELRKPGQDYADLYNALKSIGAWAHPMTSHWFVDTYLSPKQIYDRLAPYIDRGDSIFVSAVQPGYYGYFSKEVVSWLDARVAA